MLQWTAGAASIDGRRCSHGRPSMHSSSAGGAAGGDAASGGGRCYKRRPRLLRVAPTAATTGNTQCYKGDMVIDGDATQGGWRCYYRLTLMLRPALVGVLWMAPSSELSLTVARGQAG